MGERKEMGEREIRVVLEDKSPDVIHGGVVFSSRDEFELLTGLELEPKWEKKNDAYWNSLSNLSKWFAMRLQGINL